MPFDALLKQSGIFSSLQLWLIFWVQYFEDVGGGQLGLANIWEEVAVVADGDSSEKDLVDSGKDIEEWYPVVPHEDGANIEEDTEDDEVDDLCESKEEAGYDRVIFKGL